MTRTTPPSRRSGQTLWKMVVFMLGFVALLMLVSKMFLIPAMEAWSRSGTTAAEHRQLNAYSWLLMTILLVILFAGIILTFRVGRYFVGRSSPRTTTEYSDAWTESARRMKVPPEDEEDDGPDERE